MARIKDNHSAEFYKELDEGFPGFVGISPRNIPAHARLSKEEYEKLPMPNMFGGDQNHPAYSPRELNEDEDVIDNTHYKARKVGGRWQFDAVDVNGHTWISYPPPSAKLRKYIEDQDKVKTE